jgi:release factor glutamine methyltransferase
MAEKLQTIKEIFRIISQMFGVLYPPEEAGAIASLIMEEYTGMGRSIQMIAGDTNLPQTTVKNIITASSKVAAGEPLQYVLGYTYFCGHRFNVNPAVLIPRPETEELTSIIIDENPGFSGTLTDYCTGSGCIAISLALAFPEASVNATDISSAAIETARLNAVNNRAEINFSVSNLLKSKKEEPESCDIIVSNPPYVRESEKSLMRANVLEHEPGLALFVPDDNPLLYYKKLAEISREILTQEGKIYIEINEALGEQTKALLSAEDFKNIRLIRDIRGKDRIVTAQRDGRKK